MSEQLKEQKPKQWYLGTLTDNAMSNENPTHSYFSFSQLITTQLGYHPEISHQLDKLTTGEPQKLHDILGTPPTPEVMDEHFVKTLVDFIAINSVANSSVTNSSNDIKAVRIALSDASSDEFSALIGGAIETVDIAKVGNNPALGQRGVTRSTSSSYKHGFALECEVIKQLITKNIPVEIVVPFVGSMNEAALIIDHLAIQGLPRGLNGLKVLFGCDTPASVLLADRLLQYFDGLVINAKHLAQFTLAVEASNDLQITHEAVLKLISHALKSALDVNKSAILYCPNAMETSLESWMNIMPELDGVQLLLGKEVLGKEILGKQTGKQA